MSRVALEICVDTIGGAQTAAGAGVDRIELCSALDVGGLTPSVGLMQAAAELSVPCYAMIRPRAGNFTYSNAEAEIMARDISAVRDAGLAGVVFGAVTADGVLDKKLMSGLLAGCGSLKATLHRAFDATHDALLALEDAVELGFERILTAGHKRTAPEGVALIARIVHAAGSRIAIMPGSGVNAGNVADLVARTGAREVHASCASPVAPGDARLVDLGFEPTVGYRATNRTLIMDMQGALARLKETAA